MMTLEKIIVCHWPRALFVLALWLVPQAGRTATFTVTTTADTIDGSDGLLSLREAVIAANATPGADIIQLSPGTTYLLTRTGAGEDASVTGDLDITEDLTIIGGGAGSTLINAIGLSDRVFHVIGATVHFTLRGVTVRGGQTGPLEGGGGIAAYKVANLTLDNCEVRGCSAGVGGGIWAGDTPLNVQGSTVTLNSAGGAGGICSSNGIIILTDSIVSDNTATATGGPGGVALQVQCTGLFTRTRITGNAGPTSAAGVGGIHVGVNSLLSLVNCEVSGNHASSGMSGTGGGMMVSQGTANLENCTFSGNTVSGLLSGSAIYNGTGGVVDVVNCSFAYNSISGSGAAVYSSVTGTLSSRNSLYAHNSDSGGLWDISGSFASGGHNLFQSVFVGGGTGDLSGIDPIIGPLQNNGGLTLTHALLGGSHAIDAGDNAGVPPTDQRGAPRVYPAGGRVDIGAYEAGTLFVYTTADSGLGSLRQCINDANATASFKETIAFNVLGTGVHTIQPITDLPPITDAVTIDGFTQPGAAQNTVNIGNNAILEIVIDGQDARYRGLELQGGNSTIRGLVLQRFTSDAVTIASGGNLIAGNFIGTDASGTAAAGNTQAGVQIISGANNTIGGTTPDARNLISGNRDGIFMSGATATGSHIVGNYIGTDKTGAAAIPNQIGIDVQSPAAVIGGAGAGAGNVISGNSSAGIWVSASGTGAAILGNYIGTDANGTTPVPNSPGILMVACPDCLVGGSAPGEGNVISGNTTSGVMVEYNSSAVVQGNYIGLAADHITILGNPEGISVVDSSGSQIGGLAVGAGNTICGCVPGVAISGVSTRNSVRGNSFFANSLGIDLVTPGVTLNDPGDPDSGPNNLQNYPAIGGISRTGDLVSLRYSVDSTAGNSAYPITVDFYVADAGGQEGRYLIYTDSYLTPQADKIISFISPIHLSGTERIIAIATDDNGNTSEFSGSSQAVSTADDGSLESLRQLVIAANNNPGPDTIVLGPGTYRLTISGFDNNTGDLDVTGDLTIVGAGAGQTIIEAAPTLMDRFFDVTAGTALTLKAMTIQGGFVTGGQSGGGIRNEGTLQLSDCVLTGCGAGDGSGGGISSSGPLFLQRSTITGNSAGISAGGVACSGGLVVFESVISNNQDYTILGNGTGGISIGGTASFIRARITGNRSLGGAGGIRTGFGSAVVLDLCEVSDNEGGLEAGGIEALGTSLEIRDSTVSGNRCLTSGTEAAGLNSVGGSVDALNCTFAFNMLPTASLGGGIIACNTTFTARNCIFAGNLRGTGPEAIEVDFYQGLNSAGHNLLQSTKDTMITGVTAGNQLGVSPKLGPLNNNGGLTLTHALLPGSPAIDAGDNSGLPATDQRGLPRVFGAAVDIGAFEVQGGANSPPTLTAASLAGAKEEIGFPISYNTLLTATGATDPDGDPLVFILNSVDFNGLLTKDGIAVEQGTTLVGGEQLNWICYPQKGGSAVSAFTVSVSDGTAASSPVQISVDVTAPICSINNQWPSACPLTVNQVSDVNVAQVYQSINELDESRWYKLAVSPGAEITVILADLPDNYDVFLFKDIMKSYLELVDPNYTTSLEKLANLGAEAAPTAFSPTAFSPTAFSPTAFSPTAFSPTAFSPTAFSPTAFSPTAFSPTAFSPTAFSPTAFSPTAFSPTAFSPTAFSPTAFSPTAFSPTAFSPTAFSPTAFSPTAFSGAQVRSLVGVSAFPGTAPEGIYLNTWDNSGDYYICVRGRNGAYKVGVPFTLSVYMKDSACGAMPAPPTGTGLQAIPGRAQTLILVDSWGMMKPNHTDPDITVPLSADVSEMLNDLNTFAARPEIQGVVVDLGSDQLIRRLHAWSERSDVVSCPYARNVVAEAIRQLVIAYRSSNPIQYVVLVGNDNVIPFFRYADVAGIANENEYYPPVLETSSSQAALRRGTVISQEAYGSKCGLSIHGSTFPVADIPVGRLVETPADVVRILKSYPAATGGVLPRPNSSLVVGYDFLADVAAAIKAELVSSIPTGAHDELIASATTPPTNGWTATDLLNSILQRRHDILFLAGHYDGGRAMAADWETYLFGSQLAASSADLQNAIVFGAGCHVGYNFVNEYGVPKDTPEPDWAQAFAFKQVAAFVGGTGYQYGDTDFIEYNERLYRDFTRELCAGSQAAPISIGKALTQAKRRYLEETPLPRSIHEKTVLEVTLYGLPMIKVQMPKPRQPSPAHPPILNPAVGLQTFQSKPGAVGADGLGLRYQDVSFVPSVIQESRVTMRVYPPENSGSFYTLQASFLTGEQGQALTTPCEPILPLFVRDGSIAPGFGVPGAILRGIVFRGGAYIDATKDGAGDLIRPLTGAPGTEIRGVHVAFHSDIFYPIQPWSINYYGLTCGGNDQTLVYLFPAQYRSSGPASDTGTRRTFSQLDLRLYCSSNVTQYLVPPENVNPPEPVEPVVNTPAMAAAPTIANVADTVDDSGIHFKVRVTGDPGAGVQEVWVTYTAEHGAWYGQWQSLSLSQHVPPRVPAAEEDSTLWEGDLPIPVGISAADIRYMVQAVNGVGLVTMDTKLGANYVPGASAALQLLTVLVADITTVPANGSPGAPLSAVPYGQEVLLIANLRSVAGVRIQGQAIQFGIGGQRWQAVTDTDGQATIKVRLLTEPGAYLLQAAYLGTADYVSSATSKEMSVEKQGTTLSLERVPLTGVPFKMVATLKDIAGNRLSEKRVAFLVKDTSGTLVETRIGVTDGTGVAVLDAMPVLSGDYTLTAKFGGPVDIPGLALPLNFEDSCYRGTVSPTITILPDYKEPISCSLEYIGDSVAPLGADLHLAAIVKSSLADQDYSLAMVVFTVLDDASFVKAKLLSPVMADGRAFAVVSGIARLGVGVYQVKMEILGGVFQATPSIALVGIYDPSTGFVTGGGWFMSPPGAFVSSPSLTGRAQFAFVSKYKKGVSLPTGTTSFRFQMADLDFWSETYEWLVLSGAKAQYKGTGTINGAGNYGFMLTAVDGQLSGGGGIDKFRLKIWDKPTSAIVYDNQIGASDSDTPSTAIAGGSIVIHK